MDLGIIKFVIEGKAILTPRNLFMADFAGNGIIATPWIGEIHVCFTDLPMNITIIGTSRYLRIKMDVRVSKNGEPQTLDHSGGMKTFSRDQSVTEIAEAASADSSNSIVALFVMLSEFLAQNVLQDMGRTNNYIHVFVDYDGAIGVKDISKSECPDISYLNAEDNETEYRSFTGKALASGQRKKSLTKDNIEHLTQKAENGDSYAMQQLATAYLNGDGTDQDFQESFYWWNELAETGDSVAVFFNLGLMYGKGCGTAQDFDKAADCMKTAVDNGDEDAAEAYDHFINANKNIGNAKTGSAAAQAKCAALYLYLGRCLGQAGTAEEDFESAYKYAKASADQNNADGIFYLGCIRFQSIRVIVPDR